jgi:dolichyl-phosphate beta-glucosyltransferase
MKLAFSLVLPAYNESRRLPPYLVAIRDYLDQRYTAAYEVLVVDDGSTDGLAAALLPFQADWPALRLLREPENRGKGAAVRRGMLAAAGELILFADADGATPIDQEARLAAAISRGADVAVGSRLLADPNVLRHRNWRRAAAGRLFAWMAHWYFHPPVNDTQCGFKMFRRQVAQRVFSLAEESGYLFDIEVVVRAARLGYRVVEVPINWSDVPGGHLKLLSTAPRLLLGIWRLRQRLRRTGDTECLPPPS